MPGPEESNALGPASSGSVRWSAAVLAVVVAAGLGHYVLQPARALEDPGRSLQQLDLLYLDEPLPLANRLEVSPGRPTLVLVCDGGCAAPDLGDLGAAIVRTDDASVASALGLRTLDGRIGPGYVLVDVTGRLRYRTFDPAPVAHGEEIRTLLAGLP